ncbi:hypothetical protein O181_068498 [Austropuccinia psidii MF-1]|uniref:Reverse transcriptase Ty1/copia-type domain-containing protein n=1 Tax=Austropuccinia psidii MF-1 TaxID=1389203 RepID=A0A9Q3EVD4_9BASI|nr:hypothetical protein [Austropuccinia psidii MF-1]
MLELFKDQLAIKWTNNYFFLSSKGEILLEREICNRLMYITYDLPNALLTLVDGNLWHCRLGHPGRAVLKNLGLPDQDCSCLTCKTNKSSRLPFNHHFEPVSLPLDTIHIDLMGPITPESVSGPRFLLTIMDQATSYKIIRFLKRKSDSFYQFVIAKNYMENHRDRKKNWSLTEEVSSSIKNLKIYQIVLVTRNATFEERIFPTVGGGTGSPLWNIEDEQTAKDSSLLTSDSPSADCGYNQYSECLANVTTEDSADPTSTLNSPSPDSSPSNPKEPSSQQQSGDNCRTPGIKVIRPCHPTLITSDVTSIHILPYSRRARTFITTSDSAPRAYRLSLQGEDKDKWINAIAKELSAMNELKIDLKSAFLNAPLLETVYLSIPPGLEIDLRKYCLRLKKAIYGLKQAPLAWYNRLKDWLQSVGFSTCKLDPCVFYQKEPEALWIYVHVDNMAIFGTNIQLFKEQINKEFNIKDIGPADLLLGVKMQQQDDCITLDQQHFVNSLLDLYGMKNRKTVNTPLVPNEYLAPETDDKRRIFQE